MMIEILQHLDALQLELSAIDPAQDCNAAQAVADIARDLQRLVASTLGHDAGAARDAASTRNAA